MSPYSQEFRASAGQHVRAADLRGLIRRSRFVAWFGLLLLGLFVMPVVVNACLPDRRGGVQRYQARRDPTGLAPDPVTTQEAVIQVYAARRSRGAASFPYTPGSQ